MVGILGNKAITKKCKDINDQKKLEDEEKKGQPEAKGQKKNYNDKMM